MSRNTIQQRTARTMVWILCAGVLAVVVAVVIVASLPGCGGHQAPAPDQWTSDLNQDETTDLNLDGPIDHNWKVTTQGSFKRVVIQAWFKDRESFGESLDPIVDLVADRLTGEDPDKEGADHFPEGAETGSYSCLFRWSTLDAPFEGVSEDSFASQIPDWQCSAIVIMADMMPTSMKEERQILDVWKAHALLFGVPLGVYVDSVKALFLVRENEDGPIEMRELPKIYEL